MIDGPAVAKQLCSSNEKHQLSALLYVSNFLNNADNKDIPGLLIASLENILRGGDLPMKHRVLLYGIARRSPLLHSPLLAVIISDLDDATINDPACLAAASNALSILPITNILSFFARPGNEEGMYSCEESREAMSRCLSHENSRVRSGTINGFTRAAIRAYGAVYGSWGLQNVSSSRGFESWATGARFRDVLQDQVSELFNLLSNLVCLDKDQGVVAAAASALHQVVIGASNIGDIKHEGDEYWELDGSRFLLVDVLRGVSRKEMAGAEWSDFTIQAARGMFDLTNKVLGMNQAKLEALQQRTLQSSPGNIAHSALLQLGSDLIILRLFFKKAAGYDPKEAALAAVDWTERVLARDACNSMCEDSIIGTTELLRLLHLPCLRTSRPQLASSVFESALASTRGALLQTKKQTDSAYRPLLYHHLSGELLSADEVALLACALTALPWTATHNHLLASRFSRCLRLVSMIEELPVRCGMMSALAATMINNPCFGVRPASAVASIYGAAETIAILQDRAPRKLSAELDSSQLRHELATALLNACSHSFHSANNAVVFGIPKEVCVSDRLEQMRWAEAAVVLLTQEFQGWKLSDCLSWRAVDGSVNEAFPSAGAPLAYVKLLAQTLLACNRAKLVEFGAEHHLTDEEQSTIAADLVATEESLESLQAKTSAAKSAGEVDIAEALERAILETELRHHELIRSLQTPADQWAEGWSAIGESVSKLCHNLVVWTLGNVLDRGVHAALLVLLSDQWPLMASKVSEDRDPTPPRNLHTSLGRGSTPDSSSSLDGKWGRTESTGRSDSMSLGSFEDCDEMSFSESALSEDLAREIIRELFHAQPCLKFDRDDDEKENKASQGFLGGGCCSRAIAPPCTSLPYHNMLVAASLRLAVTSPQTAPMFITAFKLMINSASRSSRLAQEVGMTLAGFEDTASEVEPLIGVLSAAVSTLSRLSPQVDSEHVSTRKSTVGLDSAEDDVGDFFGAGTVVAAAVDVSPYTTPPHDPVTGPQTPGPPMQDAVLKPTLVLMDCALAACDRGFSFGEHFWSMASDEYAMTLIEVFDSQLNGGAVIPGRRTGAVHSAPFGGSSDPLVGTLSVEVSDRLLVTLVVHNATACSLTKVGARLLGGDSGMGSACEQLPSGASLRFNWTLPLVAGPIAAQAYYQNLELEVHSDSEVEVEESILDGEDNDDDGDMDFAGDDCGGGGGVDVPALLVSTLPPARLLIPTPYLLHTARFTRSALLSTWGQLPFAERLNCFAPSLEALLSLPRIHAAALVPTSGSSATMKFFTFAWRLGDAIVVAVLSAVLTSQTTPRLIGDVFKDVRAALNIGESVAHNDALAETAMLTGASTQDPMQLVHHAAVYLSVANFERVDPKWQLEVEVRCSVKEVLCDLLSDVSSWLHFLGGGVLEPHSDAQLSLAKGPMSSVFLGGSRTSRMAWTNLREQRRDQASRQKSTTRQQVY